MKYTFTLALLIQLCVISSIYCMNPEKVRVLSINQKDCPDEKVLLKNVTIAAQGNQSERIVDFIGTIQSINQDKERPLIGSINNDEEKPLIGNSIHYKKRQTSLSTKFRKITYPALFIVNTVALVGFGYFFLQELSATRKLTNDLSLANQTLHTANHVGKLFISVLDKCPQGENFLIKSAFEFLKICNCTSFEFLKIFKGL